MASGSFCLVESFSLRGHTAHAPLGWTERRDGALVTVPHRADAAGSLAEMKRLASGDLKSNRSFDVQEHVNFHTG